MIKKISKIKKVDLRKVWKNEAYDFTKWLAEEQNLSLLGEEIGIDIKLLEIESGVGTFNVDILAEEGDGGRKIVIENQLEKTNHDHLGKLITYASGYDANIIIWIFKEIREEHRKAIDWLNENTSEDFAFFGVKLEVWQIENSNLALKFQVISKPNEWSKTLKQRNKFTDTKLKQLEFWNELKSFIQERKNVSLQTPRPQHWYNVSIGTSDAHIGLTINTRDNLLGCEIYINRNRDFFNYLKDNKLKIEKGLGYKLQWRESAVASRIIVYRDKSNIENKEKYEEFFTWFLEKILSFRKVFGEYIKKFKKF